MQSNQPSVSAFVTTLNPTFLIASAVYSPNPGDSSAIPVTGASGRYSNNVNDLSLTSDKVSTTVPSVPDGIYFTSATYSLYASLEGT